MATTRRDRRRRGRKQRTRSVLTVVAVLLGALLMYQLAFRGDDGPKVATSPTPAVDAAPGSTTTTTVPQEPSLPNSSFEELSVRDPFAPVGSSTDSGSATVDTTPPTTAATSSGTISTTPTTSPAQNPSGAQEISVLDVYQVNGVTTARVQVGGSQYTVVAGQTFATDYKLVQFTDAKCADFVHGSATFNLCAGEQSNK